MVDHDGCQLSVRRQCDLLDLTRSVVYYTSQYDNSDDFAIMRLLDEQYTLTPCYGVEKMTEAMQRQGVRIGHNREPTT